MPLVLLKTLFSQVVSFTSKIKEDYMGKMLSRGLLVLYLVILIWLVLLPLALLLN